ncbi:hypothetical protein D3C77_660020 [compost metagenome]
MCLVEKAEQFCVDSNALDMQISIFPQWPGLVVPRTTGCVEVLSQATEEKRLLIAFDIIEKTLPKVRLQQSVTQMVM